MTKPDPEPTYTMHLEFYELESGRRLHEEPLHDTELARARWAACWEALRAGRVPDFEPGQSGCPIEPVFADPGGGSPRATGFIVGVPTPGGDRHCVTFDSSYFGGHARRIVAELVQRGVVQTGAKLGYRLTACPVWNGDTQTDGAGFTLDGATATVAIRPASRRSLGHEESWDSPAAEQFPVLIHRRVIDDALAEAQAAGDDEAGGFLLGHVCRDDTSCEVFLQVTCLVPAQHTEASSTSLTFTPESWAHARRLSELRGAGEILVGWMHSHPFRFCAECPVPAPPECIAKILFFSSDDLFLMEAAFPQPYTVGLLAGVEPRLEAALGHPPVRLFGWERGSVQARGFHVVGD
jgi:proteasome lid subunit RPN8/RPN11